MKTRTLRYTLMILVLFFVLYLALGYGKRSFEAFCPFGGMESLWSLFTQREFTCALGPLNLSMLIGVLGLALIAKKSFCGWACPVGFLSELAGRLSGVFWKKRPHVPSKVNSGLKLLRYVALLLTLYFTFHLGELILRGFDPYYLIFSGFGHGTLGWISMLALGILMLGSFLVPMFFCRYFCPLGATLDPFARLGLVKIVRDESSCSGCGDCSRACPQGLTPDGMINVRHRDCTNCLECMDVCPVQDALKLKCTL